MPAPDVRTLETSAVYENGTLNFGRLLPIKEGERIRVTLHVAREQVQRLPNTFQWKGSVEDLDYLINGDDLDPNEPS
jgi:predicted DNA-binding antitoxin AbrB/MazE fold protein